MKNLIKKCSLLFIFILCFQYIVICQNQQKPQRTFEELTEMAKKYGMENKIQKKSALMYVDKNYLEEYFQKESKAQKSSSESDAFLTKTANVKTYKDFFDLLNTSPIMKEAFLKSHNWNENEYQKYVDSFSKYKWRIYRNLGGGVAFFRADTKISTSELKNGKRIDRLPKF